MRKLTCCFALVFMLCMSGAAFAQTTPPTFCGDLSTEDCDILTNATTASATLDSALYDFTFDLNISNVPDLDEPLNFNMTGSGSFSGMAALQSYSMNMMSDMSMMSDPTQMMQMVADLLRGFNADANIMFNFPPALVEEMNGMPDSLNIQARLVDGFAYLNMDTLAPVLGSGSNLRGWYGIDIASLYSAMGDQMGSMMNQMGDMSSSTDMMHDMAQIYDPEFIGQFVTITRVDDGSGDVAVFQFDINMGAMMGSSEFQDLMRQQMAAQADMMGSSSMDEDDMNEALAMVSQMFKGMTFVMTEEISLTEGYVQRINGAMSFDTAGMMAAMGESSEEVPPVINVTFSLGYSSFNSAPPVTAPENATIIPYQTLLGMSGMDATPLPQMTPTMTATSAMATVEPTGETTSEATVEPTSEVTLEPTVEVTVEPTAEVTVVVPTLEPTVEVTAES